VPGRRVVGLGMFAAQAAVAAVALTFKADGGQLSERTFVLVAGVSA
jgi:hypothetical protein